VLDERRFSSLITNNKGGLSASPFFSERAFGFQRVLPGSMKALDEKSMDQKEPSDEHVA
jgi:hypothetical protein